MPSTPRPSTLLLTLRRSLRAKPSTIPYRSVPNVLARRAVTTVQSSKQGSSSEHPDPSTYSYLSASGSKHPFAAASDSSTSPSSSEELAASSSSSSDPSSSTFETVPPSADTAGSGSGGPSGSSPSGSGEGSTNGFPDIKNSQGISVIANLPQPPEPSGPSRRRELIHPFDSYAFVKHLKEAEFKGRSSQAVMEAVRKLVTDRGDRAAALMLSQEDRENQAYLFRAALAELRTELSVRARNDSMALKAMSGAIRREVDQLEQKMKEEMERLKHDIELDTNNRKDETRAELKGFNLDIEEINNKFTISLGDLRTEIEAAKWEQTRRAVAAIIIGLVAIVAVVLTYPAKTAKKSSPAQQPAQAPAKAPMRDMAVGTTSDDEFLDDIDSTITEEKLEQILHERGMDNLEVAAKKVKDKVGSRNRAAIDVDRI